MRTLERRHSGASLWENRVYYSLPRETREYVPRILAAAWLFLHPDDYSLRFPLLDTERAELVLQQPMSIGELTVCFGQKENPDGWFRTLRNLNPKLEPGDRIEAGETVRVPKVVAQAYEDRCLDGELLVRARELHEANYPPEPEMIPYIVRQSDTLGRIASRYGCVSMGELAEINRIRPPRYMIRVGQMLKIPTCD
jgi:membrane-bound lytic murein transglycosylase D